MLEAQREMTLYPDTDRQDNRAYEDKWSDYAEDLLNEEYLRGSEGE